MNSSTCGRTESDCGRNQSQPGAGQSTRWSNFDRKAAPVCYARTVLEVWSEGKVVSERGIVPSKVFDHAGFFLLGDGTSSFSVNGHSQPRTIPKSTPRTGVCPEAQDDPRHRQKAGYEFSPVRPRELNSILRELNDELLRPPSSRL